MMKSPLAFAVIAQVLGSFGAACEDAPTEPVAVVAAPAPVQIAAARPELAFRYLDPATGEPATAGTVDQIPEGARREVVVYDPSATLPSGWDLVADLSRGFPATAVPRQHFAFVSRSAAAPIVREAPTAKAGAHEVVMFSTQGCGYCAKARKYLTENRVPFTELDLEEDPAAPGRLSALGQKAGLGERDLQGVPIFFVDGTPILGWDPRRMASLLGLGG
jgi:glutaredoxin